MKKVILLMCIGFMNQSVHATSLIQKSLPELTAQSGFILQAQVEKVRSAPSKDGFMIYTFVTFEPQETLKGSIRQPKIELRFLGGTNKNDRLVVPGVPHFEEGQDVILFVKPRLGAQQMSPIVGWEQGVYHVEETKNGKIIHSYQCDKKKIKAVPVPLHTENTFLVKKYNIQKPTLRSFKQEIQRIIKMQDLKNDYVFMPLDEDSKYESIRRESVPITSGEKNEKK